MSTHENYTHVHFSSHVSSRELTPSRSIYSHAMAGPTIFDDVDKLSPDVSPDEYPDEGMLGMLLNDDEKLD